VKLTVDSNEPLEDAIRVVGSLYGVTLVVSKDTLEAGESTRRSSTKPSKRSSSTKPRRRAGVAQASSRKSRTRAAGSPGAPSTADVRSWARQAGLSVSDRGRVPASVMAAYLDTHQ
jgi:hypothetical protein